MSFSVSLFLASRIPETQNYLTFLEVVKGVSQFLSYSRLECMLTQAVRGIPINSFSMNSINSPWQHPHGKANLVKSVAPDFITVSVLLRFFFEKFSKF